MTVLNTHFNLYSLSLTHSFIHPMNTVNKVLTTIQAEYRKNLTKKTMLLDGLVVYSISTGAIQVG